MVTNENEGEILGKLSKTTKRFFLLKGGGVTPHSAKLFWAQWFSIKGGGSTPNSAKEKIR